MQNPYMQTTYQNNMSMRAPSAEAGKLAQTQQWGQQVEHAVGTLLKR